MNFHRLIALAAVSLFLTAPLRATIDLNGDGLGDIWALKYNGTALPAGGDEDGDGQTNAVEAAAGTDPLSASSVIQISTLELDVAGLHLTFATQFGKDYRLESTPSLSSPNWQSANPLVAGSGGPLTVTLPAAGATDKYYRVVVLDKDSDGDGVSDWEEIAAGFDPNNSHSNGLSAANDLQTLTQAIQSPNVVTIVPGNGTVGEPPVANASGDGGSFVVTRTGGIGPITVTYTTSGSATSGSDYTALSGSVTLPMGVNTATITVTPLNDTAAESDEAVIVTLANGANYTTGSPKVAAVIIADYTQANGNGVLAQYWNSTQATINNYANFPTGTPGLSRIEPEINNTWATGVSPSTPATTINENYFVSRYTAEVLPEFSQIYTFEIDVNSAGRLVVNGKVMYDNWGGDGVTNRTNTIEMEAGKRYPIVFEQMERTSDAFARMRWSSANRAKEVVPQNRLFANMAPQILSAREATLLKGSGTFTYNIVASGSPNSYSAANLPTGWTFSTVTGVISGSPTQAGVWEIPITATNNANGSGSAILTLTVVDTGGAITRDVWNGTFNTVANLPLATNPASTAVVNSLEGPQNVSTAYGSRLRGFITAPETGTFKFWITGNAAAELWISDDDEPANLFKRAATTAPTAYRAWSDAGAGVSPLLWLKSGQRYYVEIRHTDAGGGAGSDDHVSVGWLKPSQTGTTASEVVPGYTLSPFTLGSGQVPEGTLYVSVLQPQDASTVTLGSGVTTLRLSSDHSQAIVTVNYSNLSSGYFGMHVHDDTLPSTANKVYDLDQPPIERLQDGSFVWHIVATGGRSAEQIINDLQTGHCYFNVHSDNYQAGEIKGYFRLQDGSQIFTPPPAPPSVTDDHANRNAAARFLTQSTFGVTDAELTLVSSLGYEEWIDKHLDTASIAASHHLDYVMANRVTTDPGAVTYPTSLVTNGWWKNSVSGADQLRQRVAFALSEILVVSTDGVLEDNARGVSYFYDTLVDRAGGNFRDILEAITLTPAMGIYLDMRKNDKPDPSTGRIPNENYAREILQLFSIGLNRMHPDGSLMLNSKGAPIPTYDQEVVIGFAHVFTGWNYNQANQGNGRLPTSWSSVTADYINPMKLVPTHHDLGKKRLLNNVVLPAATVTDPATTLVDGNSVNLYDKNGLDDMKAALDSIFNHPNVGPFVCKQLIQRLVTSSPSNAYVYRVVQKFNDNGSGVRGDMKAVIKAILLDYEARSPATLAQEGYGKQREPVLRVAALARAFAPPASLAGSYTQANGTITINTTAPHKLASGQMVNLDFTGAAPTADDGNYGGSSSATASNQLIVSGANTFTVRAKDSVGGTYTQVGTAVLTVTTASAHDLVAGDFVRLDFTLGPGTDGVYAVTGINGRNFTVNAPIATTPVVPPAAPSTVTVGWLKGGYVQNGTTVTITTTTPHGLATNDIVQFHFDPDDIDDGIPTPVDGKITVIAGSDFVFTFTATDSVARDGTIVAGSNTLVLTRNGTVSTTFSNWSMGDTDTVIAQTPMRSPTVFNYFLPDFQYPGILADAGLMTPEFQLTSDTNVIRQANFLFGGIFGSSSSTTGGGSAAGLSSFKDGGGSIGLDFNKWMQNGPGGVPWTNDVNLNALIDELDTLLLGGQLTDASKGVIYNFITAHTGTTNPTYTNIPYTTPTDSQKRDRVRCIVHLIATSPEFTIQK